MAPLPKLCAKFDINISNMTILLNTVTLSITSGILAFSELDATSTVFPLLLGAIVVSAGLFALFVNVYQSNTLHRVSMKASDQDIIALANKLNGTLTKADLIKHFGMTKAEIWLKMMKMTDGNVFEYRFLENFQWGYALNSLYLDKTIAKTAEMKAISATSAKPISDADIIALAIENKGKLTASKLCVSTGLSVNEAKAKLDALQETGTFEMEVSPQGNIIYVLPDFDLLKD